MSSTIVAEAGALVGARCAALRAMAGLAVGRDSKQESDCDCRDQDPSRRNRCCSRAHVAMAMAVECGCGWARGGGEEKTLARARWAERLGLTKLGDGSFTKNRLKT